MSDPGPYALRQQVRAAFREGRNVTEYLRQALGLTHNTAEIIETAYDLQAGSYIASARQGSPAHAAYVAELAALLAPHLRPGDTLLDAGTGELTTLSALMTALPLRPARICAFDISWSRLALGTAYAREAMPPALADRLQVFVADLAAIPLADGAVDVTITTHALEPNGAALPGLLAELLRVTRRKLVLFEPSFETAPPEAQARMTRLGYIRDLAATARALGATVDAVVPLANSVNPLNPTAAFVLTPPAGRGSAGAGYTLPGTSLPLVETEGVLFSDDTGLCFPVLRGLPILRRSAGFLASALGQG